MVTHEENFTIRLSSHTERKIIRDQFVPYFKKLPSDVVKEGGNLELYAAVAARRYCQLLPDVADKVAEVRNAYEHGNAITPCVIKGTGLGYVQNLINKPDKRITGSQPLNRMDGHSALKNSEKTNSAKASEEAHHILGLTMAGLLGCRVDRFYLNSDAKDSQSSEPHNHKEYSIVIGLGDSVGVKTHLLDDQENTIASPEINRGDIVIFPPQVEHYVDDIEPHHITRKDVEGQPRTRKTFAYFSEPSEQKFTKDQLDEAEKQFLYTEKEFEAQQRGSLGHIR